MADIHELRLFPAGRIECEGGVTPGKTFGSADVGYRVWWTQSTRDEEKARTQNPLYIHHRAGTWGLLWCNDRKWFRPISLPDNDTLLESVIGQPRKAFFVCSTFTFFIFELAFSSFFLVHSFVQLLIAFQLLKDICFGFIYLDLISGRNCGYWYYTWRWDFRSSTEKIKCFKKTSHCLQSVDKEEEIGGEHKRYC